MQRQLLAVLAVIFGLLISTTNAGAQEAGAFVGGAPGPGTNLAAYSGGPVDGLPAAAPSASAFFATIGGKFVGYLVGAPDFVNIDFIEHFSASIPPNTPFIVLTPGTPPPRVFAPGYFLIAEAFVHHETPSQPRAIVRIENLSSSVIVAWEVWICPFNAFGEPLFAGGVGLTCFIGVTNNNSIQPGEIHGAAFGLAEDYETAASIEVTRRRAITADGTTWVAPSSGNPLSNATVP